MRSRHQKLIDQILLKWRRMFEKKTKIMLQAFLEDKMADSAWDIAIGTARKMELDYDLCYSL